MGSWGVKATESDYGLDLLDVVIKEQLRKANFINFNVKEALQLLREHIIKEIKHCNRGCSKDEMAFYIEVTFPDRYEYAVQLIAECLVDFITDERWVVIVDFDKKYRPIKKEIKQFYYTRNDLKSLIGELQKLMQPESDLYLSWKGGDGFEKWHLHITALLTCLHNHCERI